MDTEEFIQQELKMIREGFDLCQIRDDVWVRVSREAVGILTFEATIRRSMELYGEIIKRSVTGNPADIDEV